MGKKTKPKKSVVTASVMSVTERRNRIKALELAIATPFDGSNVVSKAKRYFDFLQGVEEPVTKEVVHLSPEVENTGEPFADARADNES
jgi:hypothetical protein